MILVLIFNRLKSRRAPFSTTLRKTELFLNHKATHRIEEPNGKMKKTILLFITLTQARLEQNLERVDKRRLNHRSQELNTLEALATQLQRCNCQEDGTRSPDVLKQIYR